VFSRLPFEDRLPLLHLYSNQSL